MIKSWLPERAVKKIKFVGRSDLNKFIPKDQALACWGGDDDSPFRFESEEKVEEAVNSNRKVGSLCMHLSDILKDKFGRTLSIFEKLLGKYYRLAEFPALKFEVYGSNLTKRNGKLYFRKMSKSS